MKHLLPILTFCGLLFTHYAVQAQDIAPPNYADVFPPSPTASSLGRFGDVPVSLYTGMPSISVPLWEIQGKEISIPISLNYHASGVKLDDLAPPMGLNWALNAGGVVTRVMMGLADDAVGGYLSNRTAVPDEFTSNGLFEQYANGSKDSQPDIFQFSLPGASGKFILNYDGTVMLMPVQNIDVQYNKTGVQITQWIITTADGIVYTLDQNESQKNTALDLNSGYAAPTYFYNSSWFLSKVETPKGDVISFTYQDYETTYRLQDSETRYTQYFQSGACGVRPDDQKFKITTLIRGKRLTKMQHLLSGETVNFYYEQPRYDLAGDKALTRIAINNVLNKAVKEFTLDYRYLQNSSLVTLPEGTTPNDLKWRLMLYSVAESKDGVSKPPYSFDYITENDMGRSLPPRLSPAQDHWGYFNNQLTNTTLCPRQNVRQLVNGREITFEVSGGIRTPEASSSVVGTLNKITYPTGGYTLLEYGAHDYHRTTRNEPEVTPKTFLYTIASSFETSEKEFTIGEGVNGKVRVNFRYPDEFVTIDPQITWMQIFREGRSLPVYYSEGYYNPATKKFQEATFDPVPGTYRIVYEGIDQSTIETGVYDLEVKWVEEVNLSTEETITVGGARIRKTTDYDPVLNSRIVKQYQYIREDEKSSGALVDLPEYGYTMEMQKGGDCFSGGQPSVGLVWVRSPTPNYVLGMTQGSHVGYSRVVVTEGGGNGNGRSVYHYTSPATHPDVFDGDQWPAAPHDTREWQRGLLTETEHYKVGSTKPLSRTDTKYNFYTYGSLNPNTLNQYVQAAKVVSICISGGCTVNVNDPNAFQINFYKVGIGYNEPYQVIETLSTQTGEAITKVTDYDYSEDHLQLSSKTFTSSEQQPLTTNYQYAQDFTDNTYGSNLLRDNHMHSQILEQTTTVGTGEAADTTQKITTQYEEVASHIVPKIITHYPTGDNTTNSEARQTEYEYDAYGNIIQVLGPDGVPTSYIWGYNYTLPVAQIVGAFYETEVETKLNLTALQSMDDKELQTVLNNLRSLDDAQVTTYTHDPLVGITSVTDPAGRISTYHYDDLNRLQWIESEEGHVVQKFDYQYAQ